MGRLETIDKRGKLSTWQKRAQADKEQKLWDNIAGSQLIAAGAGDSTADHIGAKPNSIAKL